MVTMSQHEENLVSMLVRRQPSTYYLVIFSYVILAFTILKDIGFIVGTEVFAFPIYVKYLTAISFASLCLFGAKKKWRGRAMPDGADE